MPRVRFTVWRMVVLVAVVAAVMGVFALVHCGPTFYAPGFTEDKFASLRSGMSPAEVTAVVGPPIETVQQEDGGTLWTYSNRDDCTCDFEMRWVYFRGGKVEHVVNMHWDE